jgi:glycosyltransferase involved in cell wall biosynthesis
MKICIASSGLGHVARGIEAWANDLGIALAARGEDVILCKGSGRPAATFERVVPCWTRESRKTRILLKGLPHGIAWRIGLGNGYNIEQATFAHNLIKLLKTEGVDVLHVQDPHVALLVQSAFEKGRVKTRTILAHGTEEPFEFQQRITFLQHLAPWHLEEARERGCHKDTWIALPNFIDTDHFRPGTNEALRGELDIPEDGLLILAVAAIKRHHKRIDYLTAEFHQLIDRYPELTARLVVAGGWEPQTDEVVGQARQLLGDRVRFLIRFPRERMAELYRAADIFTLGSLKEMMPIALLEATASGLPCVVNEHPVMQWMVGPGGKAADLAREGGWCEAIAPLLQDRPKRTELGQLARGYCLRNFSRDRVVDQILEYYEFVLNYV